MGVSRVDFDGETLIDLTDDTVTPQSLLSGYTAHNKAGELIEGLAVIPTVGNGAVTIKQNGVSKGTFTMNQSGNTTIELTDNNTTYGAATQSANGLMTSADKKKLDGLTSTTSLAVTKQGTSVLDGTVGKVLDDKIAEINSKISGDRSDGVEHKNSLPYTAKTFGFLFMTFGHNVSGFSEWYAVMNVSNSDGITVYSSTVSHYGTGQSTHVLALPANCTAKMSSSGGPYVISRIVFVPLF